MLFLKAERGTPLRHRSKLVTIYDRALVAVLAQLAQTGSIFCWEAACARHIARSNWQIEPPSNRARDPDLSDRPPWDNCFSIFVHHHFGSAQRVVTRHAHSQQKRSCHARALPTTIYRFR